MKQCYRINHQNVGDMFKHEYNSKFSGIVKPDIYSVSIRANSEIHRPSSVNGENDECYYTVS